MVRALLSSGAKIYLLTKRGMSPLYVACQEGHTEVVRALLSAGAMVDLPTKLGASPLYAACQKGHLEVVCTLLSGGARVDLPANDGMSPLHTTCHFGHIGAVHALLSAEPGQTCVTSMAGRPLTCCHVPCALRWSAWCSKPRRKGTA